jgi:hypothetical protein
VIHDPRKGGTIRERLSLQGNPATNDDWWTNPKTGQVVDFIDFARSEGRFSKHFDKAGNPSETLLRAREDRLENWHLLQELAGLRGGKGHTPAAKSFSHLAEKPANGSAGASPSQIASSAPKASSPSSPLEGFAIGTRIMYRDGDKWVSGVVESMEPAVLGLDDRSKIRTTANVLAAGVSEGIIVREK